MGVRRHFSKGVKRSYFACPFQFADDAMQMDVHEMLYPFKTTKKTPHVTATVTKTRFVGSNIQVYYDNFPKKISADFQSKALLFKETLPRFSTKEAFPRPLTKPHTMSLFYLARLVSIAKTQSCKSLGSRPKGPITPLINVDFCIPNHLVTRSVTKGRDSLPWQNFLSPENMSWTYCMYNHCFRTCYRCKIRTSVRKFFTPLVSQAGYGSAGDCCLVTSVSYATQLSIFTIKFSGLTSNFNRRN